jgi:hypothetical protein
VFTLDIQWLYFSFLKSGPVQTGRPRPGKGAMARESLGNH